jgi:hypothetical protein
MKTSNAVTFYYVPAGLEEGDNKAIRASTFLLGQGINSMFHLLLSKGEV